MTNTHDDWDIQQAYQEDPKKALFFLSSTILQPDKLAARIVTAINTQSALQDAIKNLFLKHIKNDPDISSALFKIVSKERKQCLHSIVFSKTTGLLGAIGILSLLGFIHPDWFTVIFQTFSKS
jgi:hypothetical protein